LTSDSPPPTTLNSGEITRLLLTFSRKLNFVPFRRKLEEKNVSLENVIIKESESTVVGTVKVKNLSFHKEVFIRSSWDSWKSHTDTFCTYSQIVGASGAYVIYDTFSFKLTLPPNSRNLEFCVCFKADGNEFWDSNNVSHSVSYFQ
jgi:protein phosphatase 1 regulatory subunit 3A/B/C/D/E